MQAVKDDNFTLDFIGIGAEKAGSTWVANCLAEHPQVCLSEPKEVHFFNKVSTYIYGGKNPNYFKSWDWYKNHFLHCREDNLKGEFSTGYLYDTEAPKNIKKYFPDARLIICLRNPIKRAYSQYLMYKSYFKKEERDFELVLRKEIEYIEKGLYYKQIKRYLNYFEMDQLLILSLDEIKAYPEKVVESIYEFLGVDSSYLPAFISNKSNQAKQVRFPFVIELMTLFSDLLVSSKLSSLLTFLKKVGFKKLVMNANTKAIKYPDMDVKTKEYLRAAFREDIIKLEHLLDKDFSSWQ